MKEKIRKINRSVLSLALPSILANITVPLVGMVDLGVAGRLGDAVAIGGMAISTMLFDLLYWNMGFLRVGTGGMVAQAYGRRDLADAAKVFVQGIGTAVSIALIILLIQYIYAEVALKFIPCSEEVAALARKYYYIRIWAAPATLSLFVFKGFFIGMQNAVSPMIADITVNVVNLALSVLFAIVLDYGFTGIAYAVLTAQYTGLILCVILFLTYYRRLLRHINIKAALNLKDLKRFFGINGNIFVRSICFLCIYAGFTSFSANFGDELLAVNTIMMKLLLLYSFFIDGFAYAGEALTGRFIGAQDKTSLKFSVKIIFRWCFGIGAVSTLCYLFGSRILVSLLTDNSQVIADSQQFYPWLWIMPAVSCAAFVWDGIYIGATATRSIRNCMIFAVIGFFATFLLFDSLIGVQALYLAFIVHCIVRTIWMTAFAKRNIGSKFNVA